MRLAACAALSIVGHLGLAELLDQLPAREVHAPPRPVQVRVIEPPPAPPPAPPPPEPPKPLEPPPPPPKLVHERPRPHPAPRPAPAETPTDTPPVTDPAPPEANPAPAPVFGVSMSSVSSAGRGPTLPVGNTTRPAPSGPADARPLPAPAAAYEVTKLPMPQGRCTGAYTEAARAAAVEGVVILDLIVDETGRARDIAVVQGLGHGLTEAAVAALQQCRFTPGERAGAPVPVRVRGFKIRFLLDEAR